MPNAELFIPVWSLRRYLSMLAELKGLTISDLKLENIMMIFENEKVLPRFIKGAIIDTPMSYKNDPTTGRTLYRCHNNFGSLYPEDAQNIMPKITDFGAAKTLPEVHPDDKSKIGKVLLDPIQPNYYRSPEVILGYGWNYSTDIWNFGVLVSSAHSYACYLPAFSSVAHLAVEYHWRHRAIHPGWTS